MRTGMWPASGQRVSPAAYPSGNRVSRRSVGLPPAAAIGSYAAASATAAPPELALPPPLSKYGPAVNNIVSAWTHAEVASKPQSVSASLLPPPVPPPVAPALHQVYSFAELRQLMKSREHGSSLLVLHLATGGCRVGEAFEQLLHSEAAHWTGALFVCLTLPPSSTAAPTTAEAPDEAEDPTAQLLHKLGAGERPCTLLIRGRRPVARLELGSSGSSSEEAPDDADTPITVPGPAAAVLTAHAAARQLHTAVAAAMLQSRLQRVEARHLGRA
ncbi:hypothetical protein ABPG75_003820 [Micractinium tetrahymenae]